MMVRRLNAEAAPSSSELLHRKIAGVALVIGGLFGAAHVTGEFVSSPMLAVLDGDVLGTEGVVSGIALAIGTVLLTSKETQAQRKSE